MKNILEKSKKPQRLSSHLFDLFLVIVCDKIRQRCQTWCQRCLHPSKNISLRPLRVQERPLPILFLQLFMLIPHESRYIYRHQPRLFKTNYILKIFLSWHNIFPILFLTQSSKEGKTILESMSSFLLQKMDIYIRDMKPCLLLKYRIG